MFAAMGMKTISLTDAAYRRLRALRREGESFSDVVNRLTGKVALLELVSVLDENATRRLRAAKRDFGKRLRRGVEAKAGRVA